MNVALYEPCGFRGCARLKNPDCSICWQCHFQTMPDTREECAALVAERPDAEPAAPAPHHLKERT